MGAVGTELQKLRFAGMVSPQAIKDNTEYVGSKGSTPRTVDTVLNGIKANSAIVVVHVGATDIAMATMKVYDSPDDSTYTALVDFDTDGTLPSATDDNGFFAFYLDLRNADRYIQIELIPGNGTAGTYAVAFAILGDLAQSPDNDTERGLVDAVWA